MPNLDKNQVEINLPWLPGVTSLHLPPLVLNFKCLALFQAAFFGKIVR